MLMYLDLPPRSLRGAVCILFVERIAEFLHPDQADEWNIFVYMYIGS